MPDSALLTYAPLSTDPIPLQVSTTGQITVVARNLDEDAIDIEQIVLDFGAAGPNAAALTAQPRAIRVKPPAPSVLGHPHPWQVVQEGLRFTFTPPPSARRARPNQALSFVFTKIAVNEAVGTITVTITETAVASAAPGPPAAREETRALGKFPKGFGVEAFSACALGVTPCTPNVAHGGAVELSWRGDAGADYELTYGTTIITHHADGTPLQPKDTYPDFRLGDEPVRLEADTTFTLTATTTPPGGSPATYQAQRTVTVYASPQIEQFEVAPARINVTTGPQPVNVQWHTRPFSSRTPVTFSVEPPLSAQEMAKSRAFFATAHPAAGTQELWLGQDHKIILTAQGWRGSPATEQQTITAYREEVEKPVENKGCLFALFSLFRKAPSPGPKHQ